MTMFRFGRGGENRFRQFRCELQTFGQLDPANALRLLIFFPAGTGEIAADDAFDGEGLGFFDDHAAAAEFVGKGLEIGGQRLAGF